jgi:hypothetical protein
MKVAVLGESPEDEAAIRILVDALLGFETNLVAPPFLRTRGWSPLLNVLPTVLKKLHYHTDADALIVIVDSDNSAPHRQAHLRSDGASDGCRLCKLRFVADQVQNGLTDVPSRGRLKTAFGLAVPAFEAWLRSGVDPRAIEATLIQRNDGRSRALRTQLKRDVYGTSRPSPAVRLTRASEEARRLAQSLDDLERLFPDGFGAFARDVRSW